MNREMNSYSSGALLSYQQKQRKVSSGKRKKSRDSSKEKPKKSKDGRIYSSPGKMMSKNFVPHTSAHTFIYKNASDDPSNLKFTSTLVRPSEFAFKGLVQSPQPRPSSKKK